MQLEMFDIPNPCIEVCETGPRGYCRGCLRSREERFQWHLKPPAEQSRINKLLAKRRKRRDEALKSGKSDPFQDPDTQLSLLD